MCAAGVVRERVVLRWPSRCAGIRFRPLDSRSTSWSTWPQQQLFTPTKPAAGQKMHLTYWSVETTSEQVAIFFLARICSARARDRVRRGNFCVDSNILRSTCKVATAALAPNHVAPIEYGRSMRMKNSIQLYNTNYYSCIILYPDRQVEICCLTSRQCRNLHFDTRQWRTASTQPYRPPTCTHFRDSN